MYIKVNDKNEIIETCYEPIEGGFEYNGEFDFNKMCFAKFENGQVVYDELAYKQAEERKQTYFQKQQYNNDINDLIRAKYSLSEELAILRQKDSKLQEYQEYFDYCEKCKTYIKNKIIKE